MFGNVPSFVVAVSGFGKEPSDGGSIMQPVTLSTLTSVKAIANINLVFMLR